MNAQNKTEPETQSIDRLFLELSQFTKATSAKEQRLLRGIGYARQAALNLCHQIEKCPASVELTEASLMASKLADDLNELLP